MSTYIILDEEPTDIEELKKKANNKSNWRIRLEAVENLKTYNCQKSKDILTRLAINDKVFKVKEAAFRAAQKLGVKIYLGKKPKGNLVKGIDKKLKHVRDKLSDNFTFEEFKHQFKTMFSEEYDIYEGDKEDKFDNWLNNKINHLPK